MTLALLNYVVAGLMRVSYEPNFFPSKYRLREVPLCKNIRIFIFYPSETNCRYKFPQKSDLGFSEIMEVVSMLKNLGSSNFLESEEAELDIQMRFLSMLVFSHYQSISTPFIFTPIDKCDGGN
ncbi:MAG: hypothetical protein CM15mP12_3820 [Gammaproteobacteria bacterium]|nr:MAG: hypothetical protein CM15mP12_3820 [Gammaproteobacteria bacterium]